MLDVSGAAFTLNGEARFLLGASYFDGLHWRSEDLTDLAANGFNLIRVWMDWGDQNFFDAHGILNEEQTLLDLVRSADQVGIVVELTILDPGTSFGYSLVQRLNAVRSVARSLRNETNVFFDIMNEHETPRGTTVFGEAKVPASHADVEELISAVKSENPAAIVTVSSLPGHTVEMTEPLSDEQRNNIDEELAAGIDVMTPHFDRDPAFAEDTDDRIGILRAHLDAAGRLIPIYLQEEHRRNYFTQTATREPTEVDFQIAAGNAKTAGAAAWVLHTEAGFDLANSSFFAALDPIETDVVNGLAAHLATITGGVEGTPP